MRILALDTSTKYFSLAIAKDDTLLAKFYRPLGPQLSRLIIPVIDRVLKRSGFALSRIDYFAVGLGPGSFTGLRVGLATIKGFAFPLAKPIIGMASLDTLALAGDMAEEYICPIIDAKRALVYSAVYCKKGRIKRRSRYLLTAIGELLKKIDRRHKVFFLGDGLSLYRNEITKKLGNLATFACESLWYPKPENLIALAREKIKNKQFDNPDTIVPLYLYPKECQIANRPPQYLAGASTPPRCAKRSSGVDMVIHAHNLPSNLGRN